MARGLCKHVGSFKATCTSFILNDGNVKLVPAQTERVRPRRLATTRRHCYVVHQWHMATRLRCMSNYMAGRGGKRGVSVII
jgi:hypothetical protein